MNIYISELTNKIEDTALSERERIDALIELGNIRHREKEQWRLNSASRPIYMRPNYLGETEFSGSGQITLRQTIQNPVEKLEIRCHAASVAAKTDARSTLKWCSELIEQYIPASRDEDDDAN